MGKVCIVPKCPMKLKIVPEKCSVFRVPQDNATREKWQAAIPGITELKPHQHVCEKHFDNNDIVRRLVKRWPDGKILIDVPYKRPRLSPSAIPSIFSYEASAGMSTTEKHLTVAMKNVDSPAIHEMCMATVNSSKPHTAAENRSISSIGGGTFKSERDNLNEGLVPQHADNGFKRITETENSRNGLNSHGNQIVQQPTDKSFASSIRGVPSTSTVHDSRNKNQVELAENEILRFSVTNDSLIVFRNENDACTVTVPKPWMVTESFAENKRRLIFFQIVTNVVSSNNELVVKKSITVDAEKTIEYHVHGKLIKHNGSSQLPCKLNDPKTLPQILTKFHILRVCDGLRDCDISFADASTVCTDSMKVNRSTACSLIGTKKSCNFCVRMRKTLLQKKSRYAKRYKLKRISALSNPIDQSKLVAMRKKLRVQRSLINRKTKRVRTLLACLQEKQDQFASIKDDLLKEQCSALNIPPVQKTALQEIIGAARPKDARGRRYTKHWIMLCMLMNKRSPSYYEYLRKHQIVPLPCTKTIRRYFSLINSKCSFDKKFFQVMKLKNVKYTRNDPFSFLHLLPFQLRISNTMKITNKNEI